MRVCVMTIASDKLRQTGGISETKKIATMAEAYDVGIAPHCPLGTSDVLQSES